MPKAIYKQGCDTSNCKLKSTTCPGSICMVCTQCLSGQDDAVLPRMGVYVLVTCVSEPGPLEFEHTAAAPPEVAFKKATDVTETFFAVPPINHQKHRPFFKANCTTTEEADTGVSIKFNWERLHYDLEWPALLSKEAPPFEYFRNTTVFL
eukprot:3644215-Amphidinium_carterae.1